MKITDLDIKKALRRLPFWWVRETLPPATFRKLAKIQLLRDVPLSGYKKKNQERMATTLLFNLVLAGAYGRTVADGRDAGRQRWRKIWDALVEGKMADQITGSERSGMVTRYLGTRKLMTARKLWDQALLHTPPAPDDPVIIVRDEEGVTIPVKEAAAELAWIMAGPDFEATRAKMRELLTSLQAHEIRLRTINDINSQHHFRAEVIQRGAIEGQRRVWMQPDMAVRQIHSGGLYLAARLYCGAQSLPKVSRSTLTIDSSPTVELDFRAHDLTIAYHLKGIAPAGDAYKPEKILPHFYKGNASAEQRQLVRGFVKIATLAALGASSKSGVAGVIFEALKEFRLRRLLQSRNETTCPAQIVQRIGEVHREIGEYLFCGASAPLMTIDGAIMLGILHRLASEGIPALGIHDAVRCRRRDRKRVMDVMEREYIALLDLPPTVIQS